MLTCRAEDGEPSRTLRVAMRDGVRLATDVYLPPARSRSRRAPVVLARMPYGRTEQVACLPAIAGVLLEYGYAVVAQDVRGRYASEGCAVPFASAEVNDAYDTLEWIEAQSWAADSVIVIGDSYDGWLAWAAAATRHRVLRAIVPGMSSTRIGDDWMYDGGAFCLSTMVDWATAGWSSRENRFVELDWGGRPLREQVDSWLAGSAVAKAFDGWISHGAGSPHWRRGVFRQVRADRIRIPALHLGGWWDFLRRGQLADWRSANRVADHQYLAMSCTDHHHVPLRPDPWLGTADDDDREFASRYVAMMLPFLAFASGRSPSPPSARVRYEIAFGDQREADTWPPRDVGRLSLHLVDGYRSVVDAHGGGFSRRAARVATRVAWLHDPECLVPSTEHDPFALLVKPVDERAVQARDDVLTFSTPPLDRPLDLIGSSTLRLRSTVTSGRQFVAKLSDVFPDGRAFRVTEGARTVPHSSSAETVVIAFRPCAYRLRPGHGLRLEIAASHFPRYLPGACANPWTDLGTSVKYEIVVGGPAGSRLDLCVGPRR